MFRVGVKVAVGVGGTYGTIAMATTVALLVEAVKVRVRGAPVVVTAKVRS